MPTENDKTNAPASTPEAKDLENKLEQKVVAKNEAKELKAENASLRKQVEELQAKLATPPAAGSDDDNYAVIGGKRYNVDRIVTAKFAGDEGRKGHLPEGLDTELAVLKR